MDITKILGKIEEREKRPVDIMYFDKKTLCKFHILFDVPHKTNPMSAKEIARKFPAFAKEMNGSTYENTLLYFYKYNKERKVYEIQDPDLEEELAELLGVKILDETFEDEEIPSYEARALTQEEHQIFREHIADIREKLANCK